MPGSPERLPARQTIWRQGCTSMLTVIVGPCEKAFYVHRGLIKQHSGFFQVVLRHRGFKEAQEDVVRLPDDDVASFACFWEWLYRRDQADTGDIFSETFGGKPGTEDDASNVLTDAVPSTEDVDSDSSKEGSQANSEEAVVRLYNFSLQFSCYVLGDKLQAPNFQAHIMQEIRRTLPSRREHLTVEHVTYVYSNTTEKNDPLREICLGCLNDQRSTSDILKDARVLTLFQQGGDVARDLATRLQTLAADEISWLHDVVAWKDDALSEQKSFLEHRESQLAELQMMPDEKIRTRGRRRKKAYGAAGNEQSYPSNIIIKEEEKVGSISPRPIVSRMVPYEIIFQSIQRGFAYIYHLVMRRSTSVEDS